MTSPADSEDIRISKSQSSRGQMTAPAGEGEFEERIGDFKESGKELTTRDMVDFAKYLQPEQTRAAVRECTMVEGPFAGSDTTGAACKELKRRFLGCDIDEQAFGPAQSRIGTAG